jgi:hypothetical protein
LEGVELSARFAFPPNSIGYCGETSFSKAFKKYLGNKSKENSLALKKEIRKFPVHYAYLKFIADAHHLDPFDYRVCEAFWLGNELLDGFEKKDLQEFVLTKLCGKGMLSKKRAKEIAGAIPDGCVPHHSFHVLVVQFVTGKVEKTLENKDKCLPSVARVVDAKNGIVERKPLTWNSRKKKFEIGGWKKEKIVFGKNGIELVSPRKGDLVAAHWGVGVKALSARETNNFERAVVKNL